MLEEAQLWFKRFRRYFKGGFVERKLACRELSDHLREVQANSLSTQKVEQILGHPFDVAENFNEVTRSRRVITRIVIFAPAVLGILLTTIWLSRDFPWWRMPFGEFSSLSLFDLQWVSGRVSTPDFRERLLACSADTDRNRDYLFDHGYLRDFSVPSSWREEVAIRPFDCTRVASATHQIPLRVKARFLELAKEKSAIVFLFSCDDPGICVHGGVAMPYTTGNEIPNDQGKYGILSVKLEPLRFSKAGAKLVAEVIDPSGATEKRFQAEGLSDYDGFGLQLLPSLLGLALSVLIWLCLLPRRLLQLAGALRQLST